MKALSTSMFIILLLACSAFAQQVIENDLKVLEGGEWVGELTYLDYNTNKKTSIKSNVTISRKPDAAGTWVFAYIYPDEPKANGNFDVALSPDGKTFNGQKVIETNRLSDGSVKIITTKDGEDNNRKALFRYTYTFNTKTFTLRKDVQYHKETDWFERNTYNWSR